MTENLKRCPFCGSEAEFNSDEFGEGVCCKSCGATLSNGVYGEEGRKLASADWNARPIEDKLHEELNKLESKNKRLREALTEIKKTVESAQDTVYPFHLALDSKDGVFILETAENALKGNENV